MRQQFISRSKDAYPMPICDRLRPRNTCGLLGHHFLAVFFPRLICRLQLVDNVIALGDGGGPLSRQSLHLLLVRGLEFEDRSFGLVPANRGVVDNATWAVVAVATFAVVVNVTVRTRRWRSGLRAAWSLSRRAD